jgi:hypothetical protein
MEADHYLVGWGSVDIRRRSWEIVPRACIMSIKA